ncbi:endonuclease-8 [Luteimonas terrae]|uniref:Endonuclease-8 n=1 Tax=Luteimonas terrae TaxID=1530191 RepID=A0ABU1Y0T0_9GAMM|nr:endonuclease-8 [Luteimonas terrae]
MSGSSEQDIDRLRNKTLRAVRSWGKHVLLEFTGFSVRIHLLMFGSYRINAGKDKPPRLSLDFRHGEVLNFHACSVKCLEGDLDDHYDWATDVMSDAWDAAAARRKLRARPDALVADALLDQALFAGVGNIIKNEVLHRIRVHPRAAPAPYRRASWPNSSRRRARTASTSIARSRPMHCASTTRCTPKPPAPAMAPLGYRKQFGEAKRRAFWCEVCQRRYGA